jgi:hypothetical protein
MSSLQQITVPALIAVVLGAAGASAGELPQYEVTGFPISPLQFSVLGSSGVQERSPTPALTVDGMPASPHQVAIIGAQTAQQIARTLNADSSATQHVED